MSTFSNNLLTCAFLETPTADPMPEGDSIADTEEMLKYCKASNGYEK